MPVLLEKLTIAENSGVDHPAHLREGWLVQKSLSPEMAHLLQDGLDTQRAPQGAEMPDLDLTKALDGVRPDIAAVFMKQQRDLAEATAIAKALQEEKLQTTFVAKARDLDRIPMGEGGQDEMASVLRKVFEADPVAYVAIEKMLKAANGALHASGAFDERGSSASGGAPGSAQEQLNQIAKQIEREEHLSYPEAMTKAVERNPELYTTHFSETRNQNKAV